MDLIYRIPIVAVGFTLFIRCYKKAAGTLSVKKLNITNICFYYLLVYCMIGGSLIFCGFRNHYLVQKIRDETTFFKGYFILLYGTIILPIFQIFVNRLMGIKDYKKFYENYVSKPVCIDVKDSNNLFSIVVILTIIGFLSTVYTIWKVGYIALFELIKGNVYLMAQRTIITREFSGNQYIRNIFALGLVPPLSYLSYIYWRQTKGRRWGVLFGILLILSILCKTYNFEKAPVILYFGFFYVIETMMGSVKNLGKAIKAVAAGIAALVFIYVVILDYSENLFSLTNGPLSRLLITQISTHFLHVDLFPNRHEYLAGSSFPKAVAWLWRTTAAGVRSGRVVMEYYNSAGVRSGTAGVMNSIYIAEAYANFGLAGVITSPLIVGFCCSFFPNIVLLQKKDPLNMTLYLVLTLSYTGSLTGGFVDYVYNILLFVLVFIFLGSKAIIHKGKLYLKIREVN